MWSVTNEHLQIISKATFNSISRPHHPSGMQLQIVVPTIVFICIVNVLVLANENFSSEEVGHKDNELTAKVDTIQKRLRDLKDGLLDKYESAKFQWQMATFEKWYQDEDKGKCNRDLAYIFEGWTPIQRRLDGSENFYRNWSDYQQGFGDTRTEFFVGLEELHQLTNSEDQVPQQLLVILGDHNKKIAYAKYDKFVVGFGEESYKIKELAGYSGTAGDGLSDIIGKKFTTMDRDNDNSKLYNCAKLWRGAWWFGYCHQSHLNGPYLGQPFSEQGEKGIIWDAWHGLNYSLKFSLMMVRPKPSML